MPRIAPTTVRTIRLRFEKEASGYNIQRPGSVKARPPATMAPELMIVWVTFISCRVEPLAFFRAAMLTTVTKTVGQGNAPIRNATYMELAVITSSPSSPTSIPRAVNCLFICFIPVIGIVCKYKLRT